MDKKRVLGNVKWVVICKTAQSLLQLVVGLLTARYLGPANYGLINYAKSVVAFAVPVMQLGLNNTLVKEIIDHPEDEDRIVGTSLLMGFVSSLVCIAMVSGFVSVFNQGEPQTILVSVLYSFSLIFQALELMQYWFHSKLKSKYPSMIMLCAHVVVSAYKIYLLITAKNVYWFVVVHSIEYGIIGVSLFGIYHKVEKRKLAFSLRLAKQLLKRSYPYIIATMMVTVFHNTDHIMLKAMAGNKENGFYTAAITCACVCQFVFYAIIDSMRPVILANRKESQSAYEKKISGLYCIVIYTALLQSVGFTFFASIIVRVLYGTEYIAAIPVLRILTWQSPFSYMGTIRNIWLLAEEKQKHLWKINLTGALLNAAMNYVLIPYWGASGAAFASLVTQVLINFVLGFVYRPISENNRLLLCGLNPKMLLELKLVRRRKVNDE